MAWWQSRSDAPTGRATRPNWTQLRTFASWLDLGIRDDRISLESSGELRNPLCDLRRSTAGEPAALTRNSATYPQHPRSGEFRSESGSARLRHLPVDGLQDVAPTR